MKKLELQGKKFGKLKVINFHLIKNGSTRWKCLCDCGNKTIVVGTKLTQGTTRSCGCYGRSVLANSRRTHGLSESPEYNIWTMIKKRCSNRNDAAYKNYGGRGIKMCDRWLTSFEKFIKDVGRRPSKFLTLDRINNNKGYFPSNVRWATRSEQSSNRRPMTKETKIKISLTKIANGKNSTF